MSITTIYTMLGGMYSVVITDVAQFVIMVIASAAVGFIAMDRVSPETLAAVVPADWSNLWFGWKLNLDWSILLPSANGCIEKDGMSLFTIFMMMVLFKGVLASAAGPAPNYDLQRILAANTPKSAAMMSGIVSVVLFIPRYLLIAGVAVLGIVFYRSQLNEMGTNVDFEKILPYVIRNFIPVGLNGALIAGLLAAFMSTFSATINAGSAYIVNDIYKRYINPNASNRNYITMSCIFTVTVVIVGILFGLMAGSINEVVNWIVAGLYGGYVAPNVLKWHWWRLNGFGYFGGMIMGIIAALVMPKLAPNMTAINCFPIILALSAATSIIASLLTPQENKETLLSFYKQVRPWGFWKPIEKLAIERDSTFKPNRNFFRDITNVGVGTIWQLTFTLIGIYRVVKDFKAMTISIAVLIATSIFLKFNWFDKLEDD